MKSPGAYNNTSRSSTTGLGLTSCATNAADAEREDDEDLDIRVLEEYLYDYGANEKRLRVDRNQRPIGLEVRDRDHAAVRTQNTLDEERAIAPKHTLKFKKIGAQFVRRFSVSPARMRGSVVPYSKMSDDHLGESSSSSRNLIDVKSNSESSRDKSFQYGISSSHKSSEDFVESVHSSSMDSRGRRRSTSVSGHGIAVAKAVDESDNEGPVYEAIEYDPFSKPPLYKNRRFRAYSALALLVISVVTIVVVVYSTKKAKEIIVAPPITYQTPAPTLAPTSSPTTSREVAGIREFIEENVLQRNGTFGNMTGEDPRMRALDWILHKDGMQVEVYDDILSQRYILALLAYALDSAAWYLCGGTDGDDNPLCVLEDNETGLADEYSVWLSDKDECSWYGVTCVDGFVKGLDLAGNSLIGELPPEIGSLQNIQILSLSANCLYGSIPSEFGGLKYLTQLELDANAFSGLFEDALFDAKNLKKLSIGNQVYTDWNCTRSDGTEVRMDYSMGDPENGFNLGLEGEILGSQISKLESLRELSIVNNYFSGQIATDIGNLNGLVMLEAGSNAFSGTIPDQITNLVKLQKLELHMNFLSGGLPTNIGKMKSLVMLSAWNNQEMNGSIPESLYNLTAIENLMLNKNSFTGTISSLIGNFRHLKRLTLNDNLFSGTLPSELGQCKDLELLWIEGTLINGTVPEEICKLRKKNLIARRPSSEVLRADCRSDNETIAPFISCSCCSSCCDHLTGQCILYDI